MLGYQNQNVLHSSLRFTFLSVRDSTLSSRRKKSRRKWPKSRLSTTRINSGFSSSKKKESNISEFSQTMLSTWIIGKFIRTTSRVERSRLSCLVSPANVKANSHIQNSPRLGSVLPTNLNTLKCRQSWKPRTNCLLPIQFRLFYLKDISTSSTALHSEL